MVGLWIVLDPMLVFHVWSHDDGRGSSNGGGIGGEVFALTIQEISIASKKNNIENNQTKKTNKKQTNELNNTKKQIKQKNKQKKQKKKTNKQASKQRLIFTGVSELNVFDDEGVYPIALEKAVFRQVHLQKLNAVP